METKYTHPGSFSRTLRIILAALFFLALSPSLTAQFSGYFLDQSSRDTRFVQRLAWDRDANALRYEVIIERDAPGGFTQVLREFTNNQFIDVSLSPGKYRFRVVPYNLLDQLSLGSEWMLIEVRPALQPELENLPAEFSPLGDGTVYELKVFGRNLVQGAQIHLRSRNNILFYPREIRISDDGSIARLLFDRERLYSGVYDIHVRNPGGLETSRAGITISYPIAAPPPVEPEIEVQVEPEPVEPVEAEPVEKIKKPKLFDIYLGASWMPLFPFYGEQDLLYGKDPSPAGAGLKFGMLHTKPAPFSLGLELAGSWYMFDDELGSSEHAVTAALNFLARKWIWDRRMACTFRLGAGFNILPDADLGQSFFMDTGISFLVFATKQLYLETGIDYFHLFTSDNSGCLRPWLGIGWQF